MLDASEVDMETFATAYPSVIDSFKGQYRFLSNFDYPVTIHALSHEFSSTEAAYQAYKFTDQPHLIPLFAAAKPWESKKLSKQHCMSRDAQLAWDQGIKLSVMRNLSVQKYTEHQDKGDLLIATRDAILVEGNDWGDTFWGECSGVGKNMLGRTLMAVRKHLVAKRGLVNQTQEIDVPHVFVFGSNLAGRHGKGAALHAKEKYGAIYGRGKGRQGDSYGLATKDGDLKRLPLARIQQHVDELLYTAKNDPKTIYLTTAVGCGLAGYKAADIAPMFAEATPNMVLPLGWRDIANPSRWKCV